jgi:asparagine synthase (glutamine-hydrolysing)
VQNGLDRALIRRATNNILPDKVRLNQIIRGVQAADWLHRMIPHWDEFIEELRQVITNNTVLQYFNSDLLQNALTEAEKGPQLVHSKSNYSLLMRSIIISRFIKQFT